MIRIFLREAGFYWSSYPVGINYYSSSKELSPIYLIENDKEQFFLIFEESNELFIKLKTSRHFEDFDFKLVEDLHEIFRKKGLAQNYSILCEDNTIRNFNFEDIERFKWNSELVNSGTNEYNDLEELYSEINIKMKDYYD